MKQGKLVRDRIPSIAVGAKFRKLKAVEYRRELARKLVEEALEFQEQPSLMELADIMEVMRAILKERGETMAQLETVRKTKARGKGTFSKRTLMS